MQPLADAQVETFAVDADQLGRTMRGQPGQFAHQPVVIVALAAREGLPRLCLFTPGQAAFYARLGWRRFDTARLGGQTVDLMEIRPA